VVVVLLIAGVLGGSYFYGYYLFSKIHKVTVTGEVARVPGQPFNILEVGSDSRAGLSGAVAAQTGASTGSVAGQRSDVIKIMHVDPTAGTITVLSIPRDTVVSMLGASVAHGFGQFNRLNTTLFTDNPSLLAQTVTANFGIPINHTIVVSFAGIINATDAIGGVKMYFPYPAKDTMSGLFVPHAGCVTISNTQALALVRSRHYQWYQNGQWNYDVTSDYGRIYRQNEYIKAMVNRAKTLYNPLTIASFLSKLPQGITLDSNFSYSELIGLAIKFHSINIGALSTYTLDTTPSQNATLGSILTVVEPGAEQQLVKIFGSQLMRPTNPPPNAQFQVVAPPVIGATAAAVTTPAHSSSSLSVSLAAATSAPVTTTTYEGDQYFDPYPC
jgi:LCP family protein required for cell wall assembly